MYFLRRFGKQCEKRILEWCVKNFTLDSLVLDVGSGNGHLCLLLASKGFSNLTGIDYSENAVKLGEALFIKHETLQPNVCFRTVDFLSLMDGELSTFDLLLDKGTFDAISLMPTEDATAESRTKHIYDLANKFKTSLSKLWAGRQSRFIITSCNFTRPELEGFFGPEFRVCHQIEHPSFSFAGASGQTVTTLVFCKE